MHPNDRVNILLVDDQPGKLLTYEAILSQLGENLITASSGREALEHLLRTDITVVLMDVSMPELDGFELAEIIRQHPRYQKTAIIFVSAVHLSDLDRLKGYASGAVDYVSVPIVPELLRAKVSVFTELYRKTRESERLNQELEKRVADRTAELEASMEKQVELARRLKEADHRKDEFLALLAHAERVHRWKQWNSLVVSSIWMTTSVCHRCRVDNLSAWKYLFVVLEGTDRENHAIDTVLETVHRYSIDCYVKF